MHVSQWCSTGLRHARVRSKGVRVYRMSATRWNDSYKWACNHKSTSVHNWTLNRMADGSEPKSKRQKMDVAVRETNIMDLPNEILHRIFSMLPNFSIHNGLAPVCQRFQTISELPEFAPHLELKIRSSFEEAAPFVASEFRKLTIKSPMKSSVLEIQFWRITLSRSRAIKTFNVEWVETS